MKLISEKKISLMIRIFYSPSEWTQKVIKVYYGVREGEGIAMVLGTPAGTEGSGHEEGQLRESIIFEFGERPLRKKQRN